MLLALETSQRRGSVALRDRRGEIVVEVLTGRDRSDDDLMPAVDRLVRGAGLAPRDLTAVGVSTGPGGFTGLRIAIASAKVLSLSLPAAVVPVPSAVVAAECTGDDLGEGPILVALAVKRGAFWCGRLARGPWGWRIEGDEGRPEAERGEVVDAASLDLRGAAALLADDHLPEAARARCAAAGVPVRALLLDARGCLLAAERRLAAGMTESALKLAPIYARPPEAVSLWEQRRRG